MISMLRRRVLSGRLERDRERFVELGADDFDLAALELTHLEQLEVREGGLERAAAGDDRDPLDPAGAQHVDRVVGRIGDRQLRRRQRKRPRHVDRAVARAYEHRLLGMQIDLEPAVVRMAALRGEELRRGMSAVDVLARDPRSDVGRGAERVDDDVVVLEQVLATDIAAKLDVAEEPGALTLWATDASQREQRTSARIRNPSAYSTEGHGWARTRARV